MKEIDHIKMELSPSFINYGKSRIEKRILRPNQQEFRTYRLELFDGEKLLSSKIIDRKEDASYLYAIEELIRARENKENIMDGSIFNVELVYKDGSSFKYYEILGSREILDSIDRIIG